MFKAHFARPGSKKKEIHANFNGGNLTSDAGILLLQAVDKKLDLISRINSRIVDPRNQAFIDHQQHEILAQRIFALALGYEDTNDHDTMRKDPAFLAAIKNSTDQNLPLASSPTICRLENRITDKEIATLSKLFVELFIESFDTPPKEITLDFDATNDTVHGNQIGECFNKYYDEHCFLPLYVFCGTQLLWCQLRSPKVGQAHGTLAILNFLVKRLREAFPDCEIIFRGDAGFSGPKLYDYCDRRGLKYIVGCSSNAVLDRLSAPIVSAAEMFFVDAGSQEPFRLFWEHEYQAKSWCCPRNVIVKAERLPDGANRIGKENTRYVVTNLLGSPQELYEKTYCARGEMENRIKEQQNMLFADRTSCHLFAANRFRLLLSSFAYVLMDTIRRTALFGTKLEKAQSSTIREKLFKIAASVKESVRRIVFEMSSSYPLASLWNLVSARLTGETAVFR